MSKTTDISGKAENFCVVDVVDHETFPDSDAGSTIRFARAPSKAHFRSYIMLGFRSRQGLAFQASETERSTPVSGLDTTYPIPAMRQQTVQLVPSTKGTTGDAFMDAIIKNFPSSSDSATGAEPKPAERPTQAEVEDAVRIDDR